MPSDGDIPPRAAIVGVAGPRLTDAERQLFAQADPLGFILFARNCREPDQVRALVAELRDAVGRDDAPILIDQEGGRVQRLGPPVWPGAPSALSFGALADRNEAAATEAAWLDGRLLAAELLALGITVDCAPVADLLHPDGHGIIGDRAFGSDPDRVALLAQALASGLLEGGVLPIVKHIPGHGRARADSHLELPVVDTAVDEMDATDFAAFRALARLPWAMTAHVVYSAIDPVHPATTSRRVIEEVVRGRIGFDGLLISDDLGMNALSGSLGSRAAAALAAGCDVALHCSGQLGDSMEVLEWATPLAPSGCDRLAQGAACIGRAKPFDAAAAATRLTALLGEVV